MKKKVFTFLMLCCAYLVDAQQSTKHGEDFANAIIQRYQPTIDAMTQKGWDHSNSIILHGMEKIYLQTHDEAYLNYIKAFVDDFLGVDGTIRGLKNELDRLHPAVLCMFLYEQTGEEKYLTAMENTTDYLLGSASVPSGFNRTPDGGFWHKNNDHYHDVMTIDGAYMANPFLLKYGLLFRDETCINTAVEQTLLVADHTFNLETNLPYHGWDYQKYHSWANPITGTSSEVWSRSIGWFSMALVDMLTYLPESHADYQKLHYLFTQLCLGIRQNQHPTDGLWYQMVMHLDREENYPETSGTGMILYALQKGVDQGLLDPSYQSVIDKGWEGFQTFIGTYEDGLPMIHSFNPGMGIKDNADDYMNVRPVSCPSSDDKQHPHGYCAVLMAASVIEY